MRSFTEKKQLSVFKYIQKVENNKCCGYHAAALEEPITKAAAALHKALRYF